MKQRNEPTVTWKLYVSITVAARIEHLIRDPLTGKPRYGLRSKIIEQLLTEWLDSQPTGLQDVLSDETVAAIETKAEERANA